MAQNQQEKLSEWRKLADPQRKAIYLDLFGLNPAQTAYFNDKNVIDHTPMTVFDDIIRNALLQYAAPKTDVVLTSLRIQFGDVDLIYGYIHSFGDPIEPQFYNMAGSLISQDGEYRKDLVPAKQYNVTTEAFPQFFNIVLPHINDLIESKTINITYQHFPANATVVLGALPTYILAIAWFCDYFMTDINVLDKHIYGMRKEMIDKFPGASEVYARIKSLKGFSVLNFLSAAKYPDSRPVSFNCGQKLIPMLKTDVANPFDISRQLWRELYINEEVSILMMNNIALGFAFTAGWYYIDGAAAEMFDNPAMRDKYANSAIAGQINIELTSAADLAHKDVSQYPSDDPRHDIQSPVDDTFAQLQREILGDIGFVNSHLRLSNRAICMMSVHTNVTLSNLWLLATSYKSTPILELPIFSRLIFDMLYSLYCLNARVGAMHADLHINNATVTRLGIRSDIKYGNTAYVLPALAGDGTDIYSLRYDGMLGCVIDFSRSIIGDMDKIAHSYGPITAGQLRVQQLSQLLALIDRHFPLVYKANKLKLEFLGDDDFARLFRICTIIDAYSLSTGAFYMLETDSRYKDVPTALREWISTVAAACEEIFMDEVNSAMQQLPPPIPHWPMRQLIGRIYTADVITWPPPPDRPVNHVINSTNPLKYDIDHPDHWNKLVHPKIALDACRAIPGRDCSNYISQNYDYVASRREGDIARVRKIAEEYQGAAEGPSLDDELVEMYGENDPAPFADVI